MHFRGSEWVLLELASIRPVLVTRSGASPRIGIYSPGVGNTLGGFARIGIHSPGVGNTLGGCALQPDASKHSTMSSPWFGHHATQLTTTCKSFIWCPHTRHTRIRRQGESRIRVPAIVFDYPRHSGATDEGMTPRSSIFAYLVPAKEEARSKDTRSPPGPSLWLGVEGKKYL
jgi:hypothetical protein